MTAGQSWIRAIQLSLRAGVASCARAREQLARAHLAGMVQGWTFDGRATASSPQTILMKMFWVHSPTAIDATFSGSNLQLPTVLIALHAQTGQCHTTRKRCRAWAGLGRRGLVKHLCWWLKGRVWRQAERGGRTSGVDPSRRQKRSRSRWSWRRSPQQPSSRRLCGPSRHA